MVQTFRNSIEEAKAAAEKLTKQRLKEPLAAKKREAAAGEAEVVDEGKKPGKQ